jgi:ferredoxin
LVTGDRGIQQLDNIFKGIGRHDVSATVADVRAFFSSSRVEVDPIACQAHGMCAELLPELIDLDDWGYPVIADVDVPRRLRPLARRAVRVCPTLALRLRATPAVTPASPSHRD